MDEYKLKQLLKSIKSQMPSLENYLNDAKDSYKRKTYLYSIEYQILFLLIEYKYNGSSLKDKIEKTVADLKKYTKVKYSSISEDGIAKYITAKPNRAISLKYKELLEDFFETTEIFKCKTEKELEDYFIQKKSKNPLNSDKYTIPKKNSNTELASIENEIITDASNEFFSGFGLIKMMPFNMSIDGYIIFMKNHKWAKEVAEKYPIQARNYLENEIYLSRGMFIGIHEYRAFCMWHGFSTDISMFKDYRKQRRILDIHNAVGVDIVIMDLLDIYQEIIGDNGKIKSKISLYDHYNKWHSNHVNSVIGDFNIPIFHKIPNLSQMQISLIQHLKSDVSNYH